MNAQTELLKAGGSILAFAGAMAKINAKFNSKALEKAKSSYEQNATTTKQNKGITKNIATAGTEQLDAKVDIKPETPTEQAKGPQKFGIETLAEGRPDADTVGQPNTNAGFGEVVSAGASETSIPANDPDVQGLIKVKEKSAARSLGATKAARDRKAAYMRMQKISGDLNIKPEDYEFKWDITDKEMRKAGYTKTQLKELAVQASFEPSKVADDLGIGDQKSEWTKDDIESYLKEQIRPSATAEDYDKYMEEKIDSGEWYEHFDRNNNSMSDTYKVWQEETETIDASKRDFSGFVF